MNRVMPGNKGWARRTNPAHPILPAPPSLYPPAFTMSLWGRVMCFLYVVGNWSLFSWIFPEDEDGNTKDRSLLGFWWECYSIHELIWGELTPLRILSLLIQGQSIFHHFFFKNNFPHKSLTNLLFIPRYLRDFAPIANKLYFMTVCCRCLEPSWFFYIRLVPGNIAELFY